jgi:hypothetical protein
MSEYENIINTVGKRRGRKPLAPEERERRRLIQKEENKRRQEARRRAHLVLQHRYAEEFDRLFTDEYKTLTNKVREIL